MNCFCVQDTQIKIAKKNRKIGGTVIFRGIYSAEETG